MQDPIANALYIVCKLLILKIDTIIFEFIQVTICTIFFIIIIFLISFQDIRFLNLTLFCIFTINVRCFLSIYIVNIYLCSFNALYLLFLSLRLLNFEFCYIENMSLKFIQLIICTIFICVILYYFLLYEHLIPKFTSVPVSHLQHNSYVTYIFISKL